MKCKIIDIQNDVMQFRFGTDGNVISIKRSEVASYKYNFEVPLSPVKPKQSSQQPVRTANVVKKNTVEKDTVKRSRVKKEGIPQNYPPFYLSASLGYKPYGNLFMEGAEFDESSYDDGKPGLLSIGVDLAYFFHHSYGIGIKANGTKRNISLLDENIKFHDRVIFLGPAFYTRWGNKFAFTSSISVGALSRKMTKIYMDENIFDDDVFDDDDDIDDIDDFKYEKESSKTSIGACLSIGFEYMISKHIGIHINADGSAGTIKSEVGLDLLSDDQNVHKMLPLKRSVFTIGYSAGIHFRF
ncbi:MAG: hypothetical protein LBQ60_16260 [Bacteroidales bacterium]|nr:hypothetical protein [Bacteroidales bacterium]